MITPSQLQLRTVSVDITFLVRQALAAQSGSPQPDAGCADLEPPLRSGSWG